MKNLFYMSILCFVFVTGCSTSKHTVQNQEVLKGDFISETALHDAIRAKDLESAKKLIQTTKNIDTQDDYGYTPLHLAVRYNMHDIAKQLLDKKANVNNIDKFDDTPLLDSTRNSTNRMSRLLLCNNANTEIADQHNMKPIHNASKNRDTYIIKMIQNPKLRILCEPLEISLDEYFKNDQKICGTIKQGVATNVKLSIAEEESESLEPLGNYDALIEQNKYCVTLDSKLKRERSYLITATGLNQIDMDMKVSTLDSLTKKDLKTTLYDDLMREFNEDFANWNAQLDKDGLIFRFKKPEVLFTHGNSEIQNEFKDILANFFPRYLKVLEEYKSEISEVIVQGHTSSEFKNANNDNERYQKNKELSQKRAQKVYDLTRSLNVNQVIQNSEWLSNYYSFSGKAYDNLIFDENGLEDPALSRRVEFRINVQSNN